MKVTATLKNYRVSPQKTRLVTSLVRGLDIKQAITELEHSSKKSSLQLVKLIKSAEANAENNFGLDAGNLFVEDIQVGEGITYKRWMPRAYGRASGIMKRTSNIRVTLNERMEGVGRKTREQIAKKQKEREKEEKHDHDEEEKKSVTSRRRRGKDAVKEDHAKGKSDFSKKMFRRKSV